MQQPLAFGLTVTRLPLCLRQGGGPVHSQLALLWCLLNPLFYEPARLRVRTFSEKVLIFFFLSLSLAIPPFGLLPHVSSLRLFSGHSGPVLTLSTDYAARASLSSLCLLVANSSLWATSPLAIAVRHIFYGFSFFSFFFFFFFFLPVMLPSEIPKLPTDSPIRGFPTIWKLLLLHDSLTRMGL